MIEINTSKLTSAVSSAERAEKECTDYRQAIRNKILSGMQSYSGERSGSFCDAQSSTQSKIAKLQRKGEALDRYGRDVENFCEKTVAKETALKGRIASLFGSFGDRYGLNSDQQWYEKWFDKACEFFGIDAQGLKDFFFDLKDNFQSMWEHTKNWYKYEGGKECVKAALCIAGAVLAVAASIVTLGAATGVIAVIGAAVGVLCAMLTASIAIWRSLSAIKQASSGVTHEAGRQLYHAEEDDFGTQLRRVGMYEAATVFDISKTVSDIINFVSDIGDFAGKVGKAGGLKGLFSKTMAGLKETFAGGFFQGVGKAFTAKFGLGKSGLDKAKAIVGLGEDTVKLFQGINDVLYSGETSSFSKCIDAVTKYTFFETARIDQSSDSKTSFFAPLKDLASMWKDGFDIVDGLGGIAQHLIFPQDSMSFSYLEDNYKPSEWRVGDFKLKDFSTYGKFVTKIKGMESFKIGSIMMPAILA